MTEEIGEERRTERSAHAVYGLIIITSALVAERTHLEDALTSLAITWGAGIVLLLAHLYSAAVAEAGAKGRWLSHAERHVLIADNIPVLAALVIPTLLIVLAGIGVIALEFALDLSIITAVLALFVVGAYQARSGGADAVVQIGIGVLGAVVGIVVIVLEVAVGH